MMKLDQERDATKLSELALQQMWKGEPEAAIATYDRALLLAESEEQQELITIRKAEALIAADREGPEIAALPSIVFRRRSPRHVYIAAAVMMRLLCEREDRKRAIFYGEIARAAAAEGAEAFPRASVLNHLGITLVADSQFKAAIATLDEALTVLSPLGFDDEQVNVLRAAIEANAGGAQLLGGEIELGVGILTGALPRLVEDYDRTECCLDLAFGHMELEHFDKAEQFARTALELASIRRQVRNANHLLGEICIRTGRYEESDAFFDVVAGFYPEFRNVKQLLVAVDLCSVINWKG